MPTSGIYLIRHRMSKFCYVGQAINIEARWKEHRRGLTNEAAGGWYRNAPTSDPEEYTYVILEIVAARVERARAESKWEAYYVEQGFILMNAAPTGNLAPDGEGLPVTNLDTGETYANAAEAARSLELSSASVTYAARFVRLAGSHRWAFAGEEDAQLEKYQQAKQGRPVDRPFPREGTSAHRIWSKCIELGNPSNAVLCAAFPHEKKSQVVIEASECRRAQGWKIPRKATS
jgi:GIY-YIG catalytic domain